jgi:DNA-binding NarL/FixJ family response regulator
MKILVVDDHALVREGLRQILGSIGSDVVVLDAGTCAQAFELAEQHLDLDLVLLDFHLPDMNGLDALDVFSKNYPELPVIMLSGSASPLMMQQVIKRGAAAFLTKSGHSEELLEVVGIILSGGVYDPIKGMASAFSANELAVFKSVRKAPTDLPSGRSFAIAFGRLRQQSHRPSPEPVRRNREKSCFRHSSRIRRQLTHPGRTGCKRIRLPPLLPGLNQMAHQAA